MDTKQLDGRVRRSLSGGGKTPKRYLRVPDEEWLRWLQAAEASGKSASAWLRDLANKAAKRTLGP